MGKYAVLLACLLATSCAGYKIWDESRCKEGYVFYEPYPYLLVVPTEHQLEDLEDERAKETVKWTASIVYLPNRARPYRVTTWAGLGKASFDFDFTNGWMLTKSSATTDNTAVLEAIADLVPSPLFPSPATYGPSSAATKGPTAIRPKLYRLEFENGMVVALTEIPVPEPYRQSWNPTRTGESGAKDPMTESQ